MTNPEQRYLVQQSQPSRFARGFAWAVALSVGLVVAVVVTALTLPASIWWLAIVVALPLAGLALLRIGGK